MGLVGIVAVSVEQIPKTHIPVVPILRNAMEPRPGFVPGFGPLLDAFPVADPAHEYKITACPRTPGGLARLKRCLNRVLAFLLRLVPHHYQKLPGRDYFGLSMPLRKMPDVARHEVVGICRLRALKKPVISLVWGNSECDIGSHEIGAGGEHEERMNVLSRDAQELRSAKYLFVFGEYGRRNAPLRFILRYTIKHGGLGAARGEEG